MCVLLKEKKLEKYIEHLVKRLIIFDTDIKSKKYVTHIIYIWDEKPILYLLFLKFVFVQLNIQLSSIFL